MNLLVAGYPREPVHKFRMWHYFSHPNLLQYQKSYFRIEIGLDKNKLRPGNSGDFNAAMLLLLFSKHEQVSDSIIAFNFSNL
jgi:hypothetical protein